MRIYRAQYAPQTTNSFFLDSWEVKEDGVWYVAVDDKARKHRVAKTSIGRGCSDEAYGFSAE